MRIILFVYHLASFFAGVSAFFNSADYSDEYAAALPRRI
jgi:hypothetical protein